MLLINSKHLTNCCRQNFHLILIFIPKKMVYLLCFQISISVYFTLEVFDNFTFCIILLMMNRNGLSAYLTIYLDTHHKNQGDFYFYFSHFLNYYYFVNIIINLFFIISNTWDLKLFHFLLIFMSVIFNYFNYLQILLKHLNFHLILI